MRASCEPHLTAVASSAWPIVSKRNSAVSSPCTKLGVIAMPPSRTQCTPLAGVRRMRRTGGREGHPGTTVSALCARSRREAFETAQCCTHGLLQGCARLGFEDTQQTIVVQPQRLLPQIAHLAHLPEQRFEWGQQG